MTSFTERAARRGGLFHLLSFLVVATREETMKTLSALFLVLVTTVSGSAQTVNLGHLQWTPGVNNAVSYFTTTNPGAITHTLTLGPATGSKKSVILGFNKHGGGYAWSSQLLGFPDVTNAQSSGSAGYGRGMLGSIRDLLHQGLYNPIQSGRFYNEGVETVVNAGADAVQVPQFQAPLFDGYEFEEPTNNKSEFDLSSLIEDVTGTFGIPAFSEQLYYVYARSPITGAMNQFQSGIINSGPHQGEPVLDPTKRIFDISNFRTTAQQPTDRDLSHVSHTLKGLRPPLAFKFLWYPKQGVTGLQKVTLSLLDSAANNNDLLLCLFELQTGRAFNYVDPNTGGPGKAVPKNKADTTCRLEYPLYILGTHNLVNKGTAVGLYIPTNDGMNRLQTNIIFNDTTNNTTSLVHTEDRRLSLYFRLNDPREQDYAGEAFQYMIARQFTAGLLSPPSASNAYGPGHFEAITQKGFVLYGTPQQIYDAVRNYHNTQ